MGKHLLHEHPKDALTRTMPDIAELARDPRVYKVTRPMSYCGMKARDTHGVDGFVTRKPFF